MPRQIRIQFPGAVYHVMARGDRREAIFVDDADRKMFLEVLGEACGRTGWRCHAYVLMGNHYHLVLETPEANLVVGMSWLQNTFTRRHNVRHKLWGHLFGGRYKAVLVDDEDAWYLPTLIDYVHLNPARAGLVALDPGIEVFPWSSLGGGYLLSPSQRNTWLHAERGLRMRGFNDDAGGRRAYLRHLEQRVRSEGEKAGHALREGQSLQTTLRRGWLFGSQAFKEKMLKLGQLVLKDGARRSNHGGDAAIIDHHLARAEALLKSGLRVCGIEGGTLSSLPRGDERKALVALVIKRQTTVPMDWIAQKLHMGTRSTVSRVVGALGKRLASDKKLSQIHNKIIKDGE